MPDDDGESFYYDHSLAPLHPGEMQEQLYLYAGDDIEYYEQPFVTGDPMGFIKTTVVKVNPPRLQSDWGWGQKSLIEIKRKQPFG